MFNNKTASGRNNICGENVAKFRKEMGLSQRQLAERLQVLGLDIEKNAIQRMESGQRFITDIEMVYLAKAFGKKTLAGILLWITGGLGRIVLSFTKPGYQRIDEG